MSLEEATPEVKLAVDLIYLLETNTLSPDVVLAALEIVKRDYQAKNHREMFNQDGNAILNKSEDR